MTSKRFAVKDFDSDRSTRTKDKYRRRYFAPAGKGAGREAQEEPGLRQAKVDVGSDESMDASDPSSASQPGSDTEPVPSSGFPDKK